MGGGGGDGGAGKAEEERQGMISSGVNAINKQFDMFNPDFFKKREMDYTNYAKPQADDQYGDAKKKLMFALARQYGTLDTSEAAQRQAKLAEAKATAEATIADNAAGYSNSARSDVENQRAALIAQVQASANPSMAASNALKQSEILSQPQQYQPLSDLFSNVTEGLASATYPYGLTGAITQLTGGTPGGKKQNPQTIVGGD